MTTEQWIFVVGIAYCIVVPIVIFDNRRRERLERLAKEKVPLEDISDLINEATEQNK